jgi:hypothetical protein
VGNQRADATEQNAADQEIRYRHGAAVASSLRAKLASAQDAWGERPA